METFSRKEIFMALLLGVAYALLMVLFVPITAWASEPNWWFTAFGKSLGSMYVWLQLCHTAGVLMAAVPIAVIISRRHQRRQFRFTLLAALVPTGAMFLLVVRAFTAFTFAGQTFEPEISVFGTASLWIDVIKIPLILMLLVAGISRISPSNKSFKSGAVNGAA